jgi:hypothetical protein
MESAAMQRKKPIQVLLDWNEAARFEEYCQSRGFKKSTLIARLVKEYLDREILPPRSQSMRKRKS